MNSNFIKENLEVLLSLIKEVLSKITIKFILKWLTIIICCLLVLLIIGFNINSYYTKPFIEGHKNYDFDYNDSETLNLQKEIRVEYYGKYKRVKKCCFRDFFNSNNKKSNKSEKYYLVFKDKNTHKYYKFKVEMFDYYIKYDDVNKIYFYNLKLDENREAFVLSNNKAFTTFIYEYEKIEELIPSINSKFKAKWYR